MFIDECTVKLRAGNGGDGCMSFRREKYIPKGGPDGGDGGNGGDVVLVGERNMADLCDYRYRPEWKAQHGEAGKGRQSFGKSGDMLELKVPIGTCVFQKQTGEFICEVIHHEQRVRILRGGKGGLGNLHFKSSTNQAPRQIIPGKPGQFGEFRLILKTIADIGLVGFPNAGKSSLLELMTNAKPKTAPYPFTTLHPYVGVIEYKDTYDTVTLADIPGLIEGAADNRGLGHRFLKHIERCRMHLIMIDMAGIDGRLPEEDYAHLLKELERYDEGFLTRPRLVVANKMDEEVAAENLERFKKIHKIKILPISIVSEIGIPEMKKIILEMIKDLRANEAEAAPLPTDVTIEDKTPNVVVVHEHYGRRAVTGVGESDEGVMVEVTDWDEDAEDAEDSEDADDDLEHTDDAEEEVSDETISDDKP